MVNKISQVIIFSNIFFVGPLNIAKRLGILYSLFVYQDLTPNSSTQLMYLFNPEHCVALEMHPRRIYLHHKYSCANWL